MNTKIAIRNSITFALLLGLSMAFTAYAQNTPMAQTSANDQPVLQLGKITVRGEKNIVRALQAIKISLDQPYSTDPKLQNVVVCRLESVAGSHLEQLLYCATNRTLTGRRNAIQAAAVAEGDPGSNLSCSSSACYEKTFADINNAINSAPEATLNVMVNGPEFHEVINNIHYPRWYQKTATLAPAASTVLHH